MSYYTQQCSLNKTDLCKEVPENVLANQNSLLHFSDSVGNYPYQQKSSREYLELLQLDSAPIKEQSRKHGPHFRFQYNYYAPLPRCKSMHKAVTSSTVSVPLCYHQDYFISHISAPHCKSKDISTEKFVNWTLIELLSELLN